MKFTVKWCEQCEHPVIVCPKCGCPSCSPAGGEVDGKPCDTCDLTYQYFRVWEFAHYAEKDIQMLRTTTDTLLEKKYEHVRKVLQTIEPWSTIPEKRLEENKEPHA